MKRTGRSRRTGARSRAHEEPRQKGEQAKTPASRSSRPRVFLLITSFEPNDAIGNDVLLSCRALRRAGYEVRILAGSWNPAYASLASEARVEAEAWRRPRGDSDLSSFHRLAGGRENSGPVEEQNRGQVSQHHAAGIFRALCAALLSFLSARVGGDGAAGEVAHRFSVGGLAIQCGRVHPAGGSAGALPGDAPHAPRRGDRGSAARRGDNRRASRREPQYPVCGRVPSQQRSLQGDRDAGRLPPAVVQTGASVSGGESGSGVERVRGRSETARGEPGSGRRPVPGAFGHAFSIAGVLHGGVGLLMRQRA